MMNKTSSYNNPTNEFPPTRGWVPRVNASHCDDFVLVIKARNFGRVFSGMLYALMLNSVNPIGTSGHFSINSSTVKVAPGSSHSTISIGRVDEGGFVLNRKHSMTVLWCDLHTVLITDIRWRAILHWRRVSSGSRRGSAWWRLWRSSRAREDNSTS